MFMSNVGAEELAEKPAEQAEDLAGEVARLASEIDVSSHRLLSCTRALTRVATGDNERRLLELARETTVAQLEQVCRRLRSTAVDDNRRGVRVRPTDAGLVRIEAMLHENEALLVMEAIERARGGGSRADGLVRLAAGGRAT